MPPAERIRPRRRLGCSLRAMMIAVTVLCLVLGLQVHRMQRQREAVAALRAEQVLILFDYHLAGGEHPPVPNWLWRWLGHDSFGRVKMLSFTVMMLGGPVSENVDDDLLVRLRKLRSVEQLWLDQCEKITDAGLVHLGSLTRLEELHLSETSVTGKGLDSLRRLHRLRVLDLDSTPMTDAGLAKLPPLASLKELWLADTAITDQSVARLARLTGLEQLDLSLTKMTPEGVERLQQALPECEIFAP